jgi:hypothetical protein
MLQRTGANIHVAELLSPSELVRQYSEIGLVGVFVRQFALFLIISLLVWILFLLYALSTLLRRRLLSFNQPLSICFDVLAFGRSQLQRLLDNDQT